MRKGFTLIELLIVLAVIAALMSVATPLALNAVKNAKASQVAQNLRNIKTAVESYINTEKELPQGTATLESKNYIKVPDGYNLVTGQSGGTLIATITYNAGDVEADRVQKFWNEIKLVGDKPAVVVTVQKWW
ncbi:MAG: type II secretion system protein [Fervidobacterium pennivorans]